MKILVLSNCRPGSGWDTYASSLKEVKSGSFSVELLNLFDSPEKQPCPGSNVFRPKEVELLKGNHVQNYLEIMGRTFPGIYFHELISRIRNERHRGLILHYSYNLVPVLGKPYNDIVTIHDLTAISKTHTPNGLKRLYAQYLMRKYSAFRNIITVSEHTKELLEMAGFSGSIGVIYPPASPNFFHIADKFSLREQLGLPQDKFLILSVGNDKPWKNLEKAYRSVESLGTGFMFVRVGKSIGNEKSFLNVDRRTLNMLYNASDVLLFPSLEEGFGFPLVEAYSTGLPTVVSDIGVFREIGEGASIFVNPLDTSSISDGILTAVNDSGALRNKSLAKSRNFTLDRFNSQMENYYKSIFQSGLP